MVVNKKGQVIFVTFMIAVVVIILALAFAFPVKEATENARGTMDCGNESISSFQKAGCLASDLTLFYFIGGMIFVAGVVAVARIYNS